MDEAFGFSVSAGRVRASEVMVQAELQASLAKSARAIAMAIVGEQAANANAQRGLIGHGSMQKSNGRSAGKVRQDLGESDAGVIVDGDVQVFPASMMFPAASPVGADGDFRKPTQMLDIEMQQIAGGGMFVTNHGHSGFKIALAI